MGHKGEAEKYNIDHMVDSKQRLRVLGFLLTIVISLISTEMFLCKENTACGNLLTVPLSLFPHCLSILIVESFL